MNTHHPSVPGLALSRLALSLIVLSSLALQGGCVSPGPRSAEAPSVAADFSVPGIGHARPLMFIAYGDMRFTNPAETNLSHPVVRRALVARVLQERPAALFLSGDLPLHGVPEDYAVLMQETQPWRDARLPVYPALGNHEFYQCQEAECLARWWGAFPQFQGRRWYSVAVGGRMRAIALDTDAPLTPGGAQRQWLERQLAGLGREVKLVMLFLHHPPLDDPQPGQAASHNVRPNEAALGEYLEGVAPTLHAKIMVVAGHVHNYEHFERGGVTYLVSGGGGAKPYTVERSVDDLYKGTEFPNFHYLRFELAGDRLVAHMMRLEDWEADAPHQWVERDRFEIALAH